MHGRPNVKVESAPAAITSLSAACRCASHPPSDPSVLPPETGTQSEMTGFSFFLTSIISQCTSSIFQATDKARFFQVSLPIFSAFAP